MQPSAAGRLGPAAQVAVLVQDLAQLMGGAHGVVVVRAGLWVEVDAELVGVVDVVAAQAHGVEGEGAVLRGPHHLADLGISSAVRPLQGDVRGRDPLGTR